jgi:ribosomal-protein-serine acetyltransferase
MRNYMADGHISLRKYRLGDEIALFDGIRESIQELTQWGFYHAGFAIEDAEEDVVSRINNWDEGQAYTFLIEAGPGPIFVGNCGLNEFEPERNQAALGWWVRTSQAGKGIATAAGRLVAQAAFEDLRLASLVIYTNANNGASRRVAEKIGAVLVKIKPEEGGIYCAVYELKPENLRTE